MIAYICSRHPLIRSRFARVTTTSSLTSDTSSFRVSMARSNHGEPSGEPTLSPEAGPSP
jgi:hypothetical protein